MHDQSHREFEKDLSLCATHAFIDELDGVWYNAYLDGIKIWCNMSCSCPVVWSLNLGSQMEITAEILLLHDPLLPHLLAIESWLSIIGIAT